MVALSFQKPLIAFKQEMVKVGSLMKAVEALGALRHAVGAAGRDLLQLACLPEVFVQTNGNRIPCHQRYARLLIKHTCATKLEILHVETQRVAGLPANQNPELPNILNQGICLTSYLDSTYRYIPP